MPCFCKETSLATLTPSATLNVRAVPPQLKNLLALLNLEPIEGPRIDEKLGEALPPGGMAWMQATLNAQMPGFAMPAFPPIAGSAVLTAMMSLSASAAMFPMDDLRKLIAELQQAAASLAANLAPQMRPLLGLPQPSLSNMALAARLTLDLRAKGVCPMVLTQLNVNAKFGATLPSYHAAMNLAANFKVPPFALPVPQLQLAQNLAAMAALGGPPGPGMPNLSDPGFLAMFKAQMKALAKLPIPQLKIPAALPGIIADLDVIVEAFGEEAFTPAGIAQINAMLNIIASWKIPLPLPAVELAANLDASPPLPDVLKGLEAVQSGGAGIAAAASASASASFTPPPILGLMEQLATLAAVLNKNLKVPPFGPCGVCDFPIDDIAASLSQVPVPDLPAGLKL